MIVRIDQICPYDTYLSTKSKSAAAAHWTFVPETMDIPWRYVGSW